MVKVTLTCENCGFQVKVESLNTKTAECISDYGKTSKISTCHSEFHCLRCGNPLEKNVKKSRGFKTLSERPNKESFIPSEMPFD